MTWQLLVQPSIRKFHRDLESLCLLVWKLSSNLSARQAFVRRLRKSLQLLSGNLQHVSIRESGQDSSIGVVERISFCTRTLCST